MEGPRGPNSRGRWLRQGEGRGRIQAPPVLLRPCRRSVSVLVSLEESPARYGFSPEQRRAWRCGTLFRKIPSLVRLLLPPGQTFSPDPLLHPRPACPRLREHPKHATPGGRVWALTFLPSRPCSLSPGRSSAPTRFPWKHDHEVLLPRPAAGPGQTPGKRLWSRRWWRSRW